MAIEDVDVNDIVDDDELNEFLGGFVFSDTMGLKPEMWDNTKPARQYALNRVLEALRRRTPPIRYADLMYPEEMKLAVLYGASEHLYTLALSTNMIGDVYVKQREIWEQKFDNEVSGFTPTLLGGIRGSSRSFGVSRR